MKSSSDHYKDFLSELARMQSQQKYLIEQANAFEEIRKITKINTKAFELAQKELLRAANYQDPLNNLIGSSAIRLAYETSLHFQKFIDIPYLKELTKSVKIHDSWQPIFNSIDTAAFNLQSHFAHFAEISTIAEASLLGVKWDTFEANYLTQSERQLFVSHSSAFSDSYATLLQAFEESSNILAFPADVTSLPTIEFFNGANIAKVVTDTEIQTFIADELTQEISQETVDNLERLLYNLDPNLITMWRGANQALKSDNPDRNRHFMVSLRELFTHVLYRLAPDDKITEWTKCDDHFHEGKPTRKARLLYICREINYEPFNDFLNKDIAAVLETINLFQRGTHEDSSSFKELHLTAIKIRVESTLRFILEVENHQQKS